MTLPSPFMSRKEQQVPHIQGSSWTGRFRLNRVARGVPTIWAPAGRSTRIMHHATDNLWQFWTRGTRVTKCYKRSSSCVFHCDVPRLCSPALVVTLDKSHHHDVPVQHAARGPRSLLQLGHGPGSSSCRPQWHRQAMGLHLWDHAAALRACQSATGPFCESMLYLL